MYSTEGETGGETELRELLGDKLSCDGGCDGRGGASEDVTSGCCDGDSSMELSSELMDWRCPAVADTTADGSLLGDEELFPLLLLPPPRIRSTLL